MPRHYPGSGFLLALLDELEEPKPWEDSDKTHSFVLNRFHGAETCRHGLLKIYIFELYTTHRF